MKKGIEWMKEEFYRTFDRVEQVAMEGGEEFKYIHIDYVKKIIDQLDKSETLSPEWIDDHSHAVAYDGMPDETEVVYVDDIKEVLVPKQEITEEQAYNKIAESFPASAKEIELVLEKYYSGMLTGFSEELNESIVRAFDVETISKKIEALTGMTVEQIEDVARNGGIVPKQEITEEQVQEYLSEHGIEVVEKEPETVADVVTTFWESYERLKEVMGMELDEELEEWINQSN